MRFHPPEYFISACLLAIMTVSPAQAGETRAFTFSEPGQGVTTVGTDGFQFTPLVDIVVTALGYYDRERNGLAATHPVALFHSGTGRQIARTRIGPHSAGRDNFRFEPIQPVVLRAGSTYVIAGFTPGNSDPPADTPGDLRIASQIIYDGYLFDFAEHLKMPKNRDLFAGRTFFGPNFEFHPAPALLSARP